MTFSVQRLRPVWTRFDILGPAAILFISVNIANVGNLAFNMIFARLMTPSQFADLTLLLTLKLGLLSLFSSFQFAMSEMTAATDIKTAKAQASHVSKLSLKLSLPLCFLIVVFAEAAGQVLNFGPWPAFAILGLALPLCLPMVIYRGLAQGRINLTKMIGSLQSEWIIRLLGCWVLWEAGFGLTGISLALVLSIIAAFIFSLDREDISLLISPENNTAFGARAFISTSLPYGILFCAQIMALDMDIMFGKAVFDDHMAGMTAGILLIQRIFFFAFLSFAMILQPLVTSTVSADAGLKSLKILLGSVSVVSLVGIGLMALMPHLFVSIFLGAQYQSVTSLIVLAGCIGASFTIAHLCTVFLIASGRKFAPLFILILAGVHLCINLTAFELTPDFSLQNYLKFKAAIIGIGAALITAFTFWSAPKEKEAQKP